MELYTNDWYAARTAHEANGYKRRRYDICTPPAVVVPVDICLKSGVLDHVEECIESGNTRFIIRDTRAVTQAGVADCIMLYRCASKEMRAETIKHWRHRLGSLISTAAYFGWVEVLELADARMRERCSSPVWYRGLRAMCIGPDFDKDNLLDWFAEKLNYDRLHWDMICVWINGDMLYEWWDGWVPGSLRVLVHERYVEHFGFRLNEHCSRTPLRMISIGFMNNMIYQTALLRSFVKNGVKLLDTREGRVRNIEVHTMNSMLRICTVLQDSDYQALIANMQDTNASAIIYHGGQRINITDAGTPDDDQALRDLSAVCCPRVMARWTGLCEAVGLPTRVLAQRWFSLQRFFY